MAVVALMAYVVIDIGRQLQKTGFMGPGLLDYSAHLAGSYWLYRTSASMIVIASDGTTESTPRIEPKVVQCEVEGRYILAKRIDPAATTSHDQGDYWILDSTSHKLAGPLDFDGFMSQRRQLGIRDEVKLRDVGEFRPKAEGEEGSRSDPSQ